MDKSIKAGWPDSHMHLSSDPGGSVFPSSFDSGSQSFVDAAYPGSDSIGGFTPSGETYPHVVSASASYDSLPANLSTGQIYEVSSNDSSGLGGSVFTDTLGSSSVTSSLTGTGPDSLSDVPSRKASLSSSIHDGPLPSHPGHSPEYEDSSMLATAARWPTSSVSGVQANPPYGMRYNASSNASNSALTPSSFYTSTNIGAGTSSQTVNPYTYTDTMQLMTPSSLSSLRLSTSSTASSQHLSTNAASTPSTNYSVQPLYTTESDTATTSALQNTRSKNTSSTTSKPRSRTSGSTRRAKFRRSRTGCMVCRKRKVKCDQDGQPCKQCRIGKRDCHYEECPPKRKRKSKSKSDSESTRVRRNTSEGAVSTSMVTAADLVQSPGQLLHQPEMSQSKSTLTEETIFSSSMAGRIKEEHDKAEEEARRAREEADELTDALFAQHTNIDEADGNDDDDDDDDDGDGDDDEVKTDQEKHAIDVVLTDERKSEKQQGIKLEDNLDAFALQFTQDDNLRAPWTSQSDPSASMTAEQWSTNTSSTGPSSNQTTEGDLTFTSLTEGSIDTLDEKSRIGSPFHKYLGLDDHTNEMVEVTEIDDGDMPWYQEQNISSNLGSTLPISLSQQDHF